jgi:hypothetical protein
MEDDLIFNCDSTSIWENVRPSVGLLVCQSVRLYVGLSVRLLVSNKFPKIVQNVKLEENA